MNLDFLKIHLSITLGRINILTSSFFLGFSLSKALHLTPKMLKSEKFFFDLIREVWLSLEGLGHLFFLSDFAKNCSG